MSEMMKIYIITLKNNEYSIISSNKCINSGKKFNLNIETFPGVDKNESENLMKDYNLEWSWAENNTKKTYCAKTGLLMFPYKTNDLRAIKGCSMSHFLLWNKCVKLNEPICILEHDSIFLREIPEDIEFYGICQINDPAGATRKGSWWSKYIKQRGSIGVHDKTWITNENERHIPDGLAGNSAYLIKPWAARLLIDKMYEIGVWPNDALMCQQLFPFLQEYYPFITKVDQEKSTTRGEI